jgi:hypothetical protein
VRPGGGLGQLRNCHGEHRFDESDPAFCDIHYLNLARRAPPRFQNSLVLTVALARTALAVAGLHETSRGIASADPNSRRTADEGGHRQDEHSRGQGQRDRQNRASDLFFARLSQERDPLKSADSRYREMSGFPPLG